MERGCRPPNPPWYELNPDVEAGAFLSFYYSDDISRIPVRAVTLPSNNKSDPNVETLTYGLFSTCGQGMRASLVKHRVPLIFFVTNRAGERVLTGYYKIRWYAPGPMNTHLRDFALAADHAHFLEEGIPLTRIGGKYSEEIQRWFRVYKHLSPGAVRVLVRLIESRPNSLELYREETARLERFNRFRTGYSYVNWAREQGFSWEDACDYLRPQDTAPRRIAVPKEALWTCGECKTQIHSKALLKRCPACGAMGALLPSTCEEM
jgi:hypothetical protein